MNQLIVYTEVSSPRVDYIFSTLLDALGIGNPTFTTDKFSFQNASEAKINYSPNRITKDEFWIKPANLLFETGVKEQTIICFEESVPKAFFKTSEGDFPFDIFAASFFLISRYEEYLPHKIDMYGRYAHENSTAFKENFLQTPLVNLWLQDFGKLLEQKIPSLTLNPKPFAFLPTYDIDIAFSYLHKGLRRNLGGFAKAMWHREWWLLTERMHVLFGKQKDPFDCYGWLDQLHGNNQLKPLYFFLLANRNRSYDKNILPQKHAMKNLLIKHDRHYDVGIHPSWQSGDKPGLLMEEIATLSHITGKTVNKSRQHYIRMSLPDTYRRLIGSGITEDYSMGYGSINGFRASYCLPHFWYDLQKEQRTNLIIFPFCYMDANSFYERHYSSQEALIEMEHYYQVTKKVSGLLITIWHNHFLGTDKMFKGWKESYRTWIEQIKGI